MDTENQKYEGHGNTWSAVAGNDFDVVALAKEAVEARGSIAKKKDNFAGIISFDAPIKALVLIQIDSEKKQSEILSFYPFLQISNPIVVKVEKIDEWRNGIEAVIWGSVGPISISFFDTLYFLNKDKYKIGETYVFHIGAVAYTFEKRIKDLIIEPTEGPLKGEKLYTQKMTSFMPSHEYGGEFTFVCPFVSFSGSAGFLNQSFNIFPFYVRSNEDDSAVFNAPMYVNKNLIKKDLNINDSIEGSAWLQGYLADSLENEEK